MVEMQTELLELLRGVDMDGNQTLDYREFLAATMEKVTNSTRRVVSTCHHATAFFYPLARHRVAPISTCSFCLLAALPSLELANPILDHEIFFSRSWGDTDVKSVFLRGENLRKAFDHFDFENKGHISASDLMQVRLPLHLCFRWYTDSSCCYPFARVEAPVQHPNTELCTYSWILIFWGKESSDYKTSFALQRSTVYCS